MLYLVDTNVLSELARPKPNAKTTRMFAEHFVDIRLASVSLHEINYGIERLPDGKRKQTLREAMNAITSGIIVLSYDTAAAQWHAVQRARLVRVGKAPTFVDGLIAAIAAVTDCALITFNMKDFRDFEIKITQWA